MLFAVCMDRIEIADRFGPLARFHPPRDPQQVREDEILVLFDEAPTTYRGRALAFRNDLQGRTLPRRLDTATWPELATLPTEVVRILVLNGFGTGWGDVLIGTAVLAALHARIRALGKEPRIDFFLHPLGSNRQRHLEIYKLNPHLHRVHYTALTLAEYRDYDFYISTESYVAEPRFTQVDVYTFFLERLGLTDTQPLLRLYPDPAVLAEVEVAVRPWRSAARSPVLLVNFFASPLRAVPSFKWGEFVRTLVRDYELVFTADGEERARLAGFLGSLPQEVGDRCRDLSELSARSFDHLIGVVQHGCAVVVTPDTSVLHVCGGLNKPCVGLFFSIEPDHRTRYYPSVTGYCHPAWRTSRFWGLSKPVEAAEAAGIHEDPQLLDLWRGVAVEDIRELVEEVRGRPARLPNLPAVPAASAQPVRSRPRVLALSGSTFPVGVERDDFTELLSWILPPDCEVEVARLRPLEFRPLGEYDLVLFGLGDRLDEVVLAQPGLVPYLRAARACVGIFGLRHAESLPGETLGELLAHLRVWFATGQAEREQWGQLAARAEWLGEWRAGRTPPGCWELDRELVADEGMLCQRPWDEARRLVQRYRRVRCATLATALAALGTAAELSWEERRDYKGQAAGVVGPLLAEVLGRDVPAGLAIPVDPGAYPAYRMRTALALETLRREILGLLAPAPVV